MPVFTGREGEYIDIEDAQTLIQGHNGNIKAVFFGKEKLQEMLDQAGSVGLRMYFAKIADNSETLVVAATDEDGEDIETLVLDSGKPCPPFCAKSSSLMR